ncbi:AMP-binding protein, partial [Geobacillus sp. ZGt-1]
MNAPLVLHHFFDRAVALYGDKTAMICSGRTVTYRELGERVSRLANGLRGLGVRKGDRVAYLAPNTLEMLEGFYGVFEVGGVMVPLNTRLKPDDYVFILNHSETKVLFVDQELYGLIAPVKNKLETVEEIIVHHKTEAAIDETAYEEWLAAQSSAPVPRPMIDENDICSLLYTSGTTGNPKGVMLTHRNNYLHALVTMHHLRVSDRDTYLHVL